MPALQRHRQEEGRPELRAARYEGKPGAEDKLFKHIISGERIKLTDGHKENHKSLKDLNPHEERNLVRWILAQGD